ncbi:MULTISPECIES: hypothetical protein [Streptomyces]|uniref:Uncharacterized protein n=2 Tax=Streptomyces TaxID=1883 RepID=A0A2N8P8Z1_STRNR|nr:MULTISPECIES: hypothetical protein [Streptomyces]PNE37476.1 hypothetical protein AOB60_24560 [Streptomyces noursei]SHM18585.1 hypothetical protein SAMN05216268_10947 [Streptomyces yunnanensis]
MRIRAAIAASALAATIVLGAAGTALAGDDDYHERNYGRGWYNGYSFDAAVVDGNPIFHDGAHRGHFSHGRERFDGE